jgi:hypothetical protein
MNSMGGKAISIADMQSNITDLLNKSPNMTIENSKRKPNSKAPVISNA